MRLARIAPLLAGCLLVAARLVAANNELPSSKERWIHLDSTHFSLYSSASEKTARRLLTPRLTSCSSAVNTPGLVIATSRYSDATAA